MRYALRKAKEGFTLIELMIVVAIVGVLAVLAIYGVKKYIANSKTAEARNNLGQIGKDSASHYEKESMSGAVLSQGSSTAVSRSLCASSTNNVPSAITSVKGQKYQSNPTEWATGTFNTGWQCLKFSVDQPQYYMYSYGATGNSGALNDTFTATANGDLNGDGIASTFTIAGDIGAGFVLNVAPNIIETNPEE